LILPEDDANREMANGFILNDCVIHRNINVLKAAGGWIKAVKKIDECGLDHYPERRLLLLIDFDDGATTRLTSIKAEINEQFADRVYIMGTASEPEQLRKAFGKSFEEIGLEAARQCAEGKDDFWKHDLLKNNAAELARLSQHVREIVIRS
jgi:hypothetical protein